MLHVCMPWGVGVGCDEHCVLSPMTQDSIVHFAGNVRTASIIFFWSSSTDRAPWEVVSIWLFDGLSVLLTKVQRHEEKLLVLSCRWPSRFRSWTLRSDVRDLGSRLEGELCTDAKCLRLPFQSLEWRVARLHRRPMKMLCSCDSLPTVTVGCDLVKGTNFTKAELEYPP